MCNDKVLLIDSFPAFKGLWCLWALSLRSHRPFGKKHRKVRGTSFAPFLGTFLGTSLETSFCTPLWKLLFVHLF